MRLTLNEFYRINNDIFSGEPQTEGFCFGGVTEMPLSQGVRSLFEREALRRYGHFETIYDDPAEFQINFASFCSARREIWEKLEKTVNFEYNPINNYDRNEEVTEERDSQRRGEQKSSATSKYDSTLENDDTLKVAAYNSTDFENKDKRTSASKNDSSSKSDGKSRVSEDANELVARKVRISGNIGVTTTQEMIEAERKVVLFSLLEHICDEFKREFLVMVY